MTQFITYATTSDLPLGPAVDTVCLGFIHSPLRRHHMNAAPSLNPTPALVQVCDRISGCTCHSSAPPHQIPVEQICNCPLLSETAGSRLLIPVKPLPVAAHRRAADASVCCSEGTAVTTFINCSGKCHSTLPCWFDFSHILAWRWMIYCCQWDALSNTWAGCLYRCAPLKRKTPTVYVLGFKVKFWHVVRLSVALMLYQFRQFINAKFVFLMNQWWNFWSFQGKWRCLNR